MTTKKEKPKTKQLAEMKELLQRTQANFENYQKNTEKRVAELQQMAGKNIILQILPIIDNFELALKTVDHKQNQKEFVKGVELIYSQFLNVLENNNVKVIETENQSFDPYFHEALMKVESDLPENTIVEEFQKGFTLNDKVIRHARVKISAGKMEEMKNV